MNPNDKNGKLPRNPSLASPASSPGLGARGGSDWRARASQVMGPSPMAGGPMRNPSMGGSMGNPGVPNDGMTNGQAFQAGQQFGNVVNNAIDADRTINTAVYGALSGSTTGRQASGTKPGSMPDGGGCTSCGDSGGGGTSGGSASGVKALCSVAYFHGLIDEATIKADYKRMHHYSMSTRKGYQIWSMPLARWLYKKPILFKYTFGILAKCWATHMAYKEGVSNNPSIVGGLLEMVGVPLCWIIGKTFARNMPDLK